MPPATRVGDMGLGHGSFAPSPCSAGSPNVITGSSAQARKGDPLVPHLSPDPSPPHPRSYSAGSSTVKVNSKSAVRIGDSISCGGMSVQGIGSVIIGG